MKNLFFLLIIFIFSSCIDDDVDYRKEGDGTQINIFLVKDYQIEPEQTKVELTNLELENVPWLKHADIEFYDWSSHIFYLNNEKERAKYSGKYFLVKADNEPLFLGYFISPLSSSMLYFPSILAWDNMFLPNDVAKIGGFGNFHKKDMDSNVKFKKSMENAGLLKKGIEVDLIDLKRKNSTTLKYSFKVTNLDTESIYILDPDKMGSSRFHYYTNGVNIQKDSKYFWPNDFDSTPSDKINLSWYHKLAPGSSVTRTVSQNGYTNLPTGEVKASFVFPGASLKKSGEWRKSDGRIWLGEFWVEKELIIE